MKTILFIINSYSYFESHKKEFILNLSKKYKVYVAIPSSTNDPVIYNNIFYLRYNFNRRINIISDLVSIYNLFHIIKSCKPDLIHAFTIKPIIFTNILSKILKIRAISNFSGLGTVISNNSIKYKFLKNFFFIIIKLFSSKVNVVITQTEYDKNLLIKNKIFNNNNIYIVPGSGIKINENKYVNFPTNKFIVLMSSRLLKQKGLEFFCQLSNLNENKLIEFHLIGNIDNDNPDSYKSNEVTKLIENSKVKWFGHQSDTSKFYQNCDLLCFPSIYGEGIPKAVLEASSNLKPTIGFYSAGLNEVIINNESGFLIKNKNINEMLNKIYFFYDNPSAKINFGKSAEKLIHDKFSIELINEKMTKIHKLIIK